MTQTPMTQTYRVEMATFRNGEFLAWDDRGVFQSRRAAWDFIKSCGFSASDMDDKFMAYPDN